MAQFRAGQFVEITWPNDEIVIKGRLHCKPPRVVMPSVTAASYFVVPGTYEEDGRRVRLLEDPAPTVLGTVVLATSPVDGQRCYWTTVPEGGGKPRFYRSGGNWMYWDGLEDPVVVGEEGVEICPTPGCLLPAEHTSTGTCLSPTAASKHWPRGGTVNA